MLFLPYQSQTRLHHPLQHRLTAPLGLTPRAHTTSTGTSPRFCNTLRPHRWWATEDNTLRVSLTSGGRHQQRCKAHPVDIRTSMWPDGEYERPQASNVANTMCSSGSKLGGACSRHHGRPQGSPQSETAVLVSKRHSHRSSRRHDRRHDRRTRRPKDRSWTVREQDCLDTILLMDNLTKHHRAASVVRPFPNPAPLGPVVNVRRCKNMATRKEVARSTNYFLESFERDTT